MAADVEWSFLALFRIERVHRDLTRGLVWLQLQNDGVHTKERIVRVTVARRLVPGVEVFLTADGAGHDVAYERVALGQIRREVHFLPFVFFLDAEPWKAKVGTNGISFNKINLAV